MILIHILDKCKYHYINKEDALYIMIKSTILSLFMVFSTVTCWITFLFIDIGSFLHFDILLNCFVMSLSFFYNDSYYRFLCAPMIGCCNKCFGYNYLIELQMVANMDHTNEKKLSPQGNSLSSSSGTTTTTTITTTVTTATTTTTSTIEERENNQSSVDNAESDEEVP